LGTTGDFQSGLSIASKADCTPLAQASRTMAKYGLVSSMQASSSQRSESASYTKRSMGKPTDTLDFNVASIETKAHFVAWGSGVLGTSMRSSTGLPYFDSPIWK